MPDVDSLLLDDAITHTVETDVLIVGTGPAGASLAAFFTTYGIHGLAISRDPGGITTPRSHVTNQGTVECLRELRLQESAEKAATSYKVFANVAFCDSLTGEEFTRVPIAGVGSARAKHEDKSPCVAFDLTQNQLEPILVGYATRNGFTCRFDTDFLTFEKNADGTLTSIVADRASKSKYAITSKYLFACDGGRSKIVDQLGLPLNKGTGGGGFAINVHLKADLSKQMKYRPNLLNFCVRPGQERPTFSAATIARAVKPWDEWLFVLLPFPGTSIDIEPSSEAIVDICKLSIGDDSIPFEILHTSKWVINETFAEKYSDGNVFALGDAVHRHPPHNGLGSNTSIQDAYNLAWKVAYVLQGRASPSILDSYNAERQPVGAGVIKRVFEAYAEDAAVIEALGMMAPTPEARQKAHDELGQATAEGKARRERLRRAMQGECNIYQGMGIEMNQQYDSNAIYVKDESGPRPSLPEDTVKDCQISTYPGARLPHACLNTRLPGPKKSTHDLAGHGVFTLFTGHGGEKWKTAAVKVSNMLGVQIVPYTIGWKLDYEDSDFMWAERREVEEDGCVLVRPDRFVAWRSTSCIDRCESKLELVMRSILGR